MRWGTGGWYLLIYVAAALGVGRLGRRLGSSPWLAGCLLTGVFTLVHLLYWSNMRMRAPLIPVLALLAAVGITDIFGRFARVLRT